MGNQLETIIGPGDSGGAALRQTTNGWELVGINTFTEGFGGRFGDSGGGILVAPYTDWIYQTTGIPRAIHNDNIDFFSRPSCQHEKQI